MKKRYVIAFASIVLLLFVFSFVKVNTIIWVGWYYSDYSRYSDFDIVLKIDGKEILSDTLRGGFPFYPEFEIEERLTYGFHQVSVYSNRANIYQEEKIFLLPKQHISLELLLADTLTFLNYSIPDSVYINGIELTDSIIEQYKNPSRYYDSLFQKLLDVPIASEKSRFAIQTNVKFYTR